MNNLFVIMISLLDATSILPLNSELVLLNSLDKTSYTFTNYLKRSLWLYILPSILGTWLAYYIGYFFNEKILYYIDFVMCNVFSNNIVINKNTILTTLLVKIFIPLVPISIINILCGIYQISFWRFTIISCILRLTRILLLYNTIVYVNTSIFSSVFYIGVYCVFLRILVYLFYTFLFTL